MGKVIIIEQGAYEMMKKHFDVFFKEIELLCGESNINKNWLDSQDVCMLLHISKRTLQDYRDNHIIPFSKIGNKCYYKTSDIEKLISGSNIK